MEVLKLRKYVLSQSWKQNIQDVNVSRTTVTQKSLSFQWFLPYLAQLAFTGVTPILASDYMWPCLSSPWCLCVPSLLLTAQSCDSLTLSTYTEILFPTKAIRWVPREARVEPQYVSWENKVQTITLSEYVRTQFSQFLARTLLIVRFQGCYCENPATMKRILGGNDFESLL